jgi:TetR/AcrR family transcriptional regulator, cholesterol catabolism regulator
MGEAEAAPLTTRQARRLLSAEERKAEIVLTAAQLFDEAGYANTTMEDIARAVGIAKPTLYHYFPSKDEILYDIHGEFIDLLIDRHNQRLAVGLGPEQQLLEVIADILELMETHRGHVRVFFEHYRELPAAQQATIKVKRDSYEKAVETIFREGCESGVFRDLDPRLASLATFGMCNWGYQWYQAAGKYRPRELAYIFWGFLVNGIGTGTPDIPA